MSLGDALWREWLAEYARLAGDMVAKARPARVLDLGCGDGSFVLSLAAYMPGAVVHGIENHPGKTLAARRGGIAAVSADLEAPLPYPDHAFDVVMAHFVIEHLFDVDGLLAETRRVLRPGGLAVFGTENLAAWHNVAALFLGFQPFTMTIALSSRWRLGNPLQPGRLQPMAPDESPHVRVFAWQGFRDIFAVHGFSVTAQRGVGYAPAPGGAGRLLARLDPRHAALMLLSARKAGASSGSPA